MVHVLRISAFSMVIILSFLIFHKSTYAQDDALAANESTDFDNGLQIDPAMDNTSTGAANVENVSWLSGGELSLSFMILIFGICIIGIEYFLLRQIVQDHVSEIMKTFTVTLIIIGTLLLISSGFSSEQIGPALGLFGTIAGYLLGREEQKVKTERNDEK